MSDVPLVKEIKLIVSIHITSLTSIILDVHFFCGWENLREALSRVTEGVTMRVTHGNLTNFGNVTKTVKNVRLIVGDIRWGGFLLQNLFGGGIGTPTDVALMMQLGCDGVFVGSELPPQLAVVVTGPIVIADMGTEGLAKRGRSKPRKYGPDGKLNVALSPRPIFCCGSVPWEIFFAWRQAAWYHR
ncbi:hypothetical protein ACFE04_001956 [Oxalis oulophora]